MKHLPLALLSIFFTSSAYANPIVEILHDRLEVGVMATYVAPLETTTIPLYLQHMDRTPGTVVAENYVGSLFSPNQNTGSVHAAAQSNIVWGVANVDYEISSDRFHVESWVVLDDDMGLYGLFPPIGTTAIAQITWEAIFRVEGDGAMLSASKGSFTALGALGATQELYDLSIGSVVFSGSGYCSLIDNHTYSFSSNIMTQQSGYVGSAIDGDVTSHFSISNALVKVPEPNSMLFFGAGLAGLAGLRGRKKA